MVFPGAADTGFEGFKGWYDRVVNYFLWWNTPERSQSCPKAIKLRFGGCEMGRVCKSTSRVNGLFWITYQTWIMQRSPTTQQPVILRYIVDSLEYARRVLLALTAEEKRKVAVRKLRGTIWWISSQQITWLSSISVKMSQMSIRNATF